MSIAFIVSEQILYRNRLKCLMFDTICMTPYEILLHKEFKFTLNESAYKVA